MLNEVLQHGPLNHRYNTTDYSQLRCMLEEWESGVHLLVAFEVALYRELYLGIVANFKAIEGRPTLYTKLKVLWVQIHCRGWCVLSYFMINQTLTAFKPTDHKPNQTKHAGG
jgi:hypothetical protein